MIARIVHPNSKLFLCKGIDMYMYKQMSCYLLVAIMLSFHLGCTGVEKNSDMKKVEEFMDFQLPMYKTAENPKEGFNKKYLIKYVEYNVDMYYPAEDIIEFYDNEMKKRSFEPFVEDYFKKRDRSWDTYTDGTIKGGPDVTSCKMSWADKDQSKRATLVLKYYWRNKEKRRILNSNKDLEVEFRVQPFYQEPPQ